MLILGRYHTDPSGAFSKYDAKAIGAGSEGAQSALHDGYNKSLTLKEAETLALTTLKQVMEEKVTKSNVEIATIAASNRQFHLYTPDEVQDVISRL